MPSVLRRRLSTARKPPVGARVDWGRPLADGLVGAWLFTDGSRTPRELTAGLATTLSGAPTYTAGPLGRALLFNRSTPDYTITNNDRLNCPVGWTIVLACRPMVAFTNYENLIARTVAGDIQYGIIILGDGTWIAQGHGANLFATVLTLNQDVVLAATMDSAGVAQAYVNGRNVSGPGALNPGTLTNAPLYLANDVDNGRPFDGLLYYAYVYNRPLPPAAIAQLYATPYAMLAPPATHQRWWLLAGSTIARTGTAIGRAGAHGQTVGAPARLSASTGHAGAHGQVAGVSARTATATGHAGAHGQAVAVPARTGTASGSTGAHGQCVGVAAHTATIAGHAGSHGQTAAAAARLSGTLGHTGAEGQTAAATTRTGTATGHAGSQGQTAATTTRTGTATGHTGTHGQAVGSTSTATTGTVSGSAGAHGQCVGVATRTGTATGHTGAEALTVGVSARTAAGLGHTGSQGQTSEQTTAAVGTATGHAGAHGQCVGVAARTSTAQGHAGSASASLLQAVRYSVTLGHAGAHALLGGTTARGAGVLGHAGAHGSTGSSSGERNITVTVGSGGTRWTARGGGTRWTVGQGVR